MISIKKEGKKHCAFCGKKISLKKDNFVLVGTYNRARSNDDEQFYHFQCWVDYFNNCVLNKAKANIKFMQEKAMSLFNNPVMKSMLSQISGSNQILSMLQTPLEEKDVNYIKKIQIKIEDGRKQKKGKKRK